LREFSTSWSAKLFDVLGAFVDINGTVKLEGAGVGQAER
jgi:hypothetical protein